MTKITYWHGVIATADELAEFGQTIAKIVANDNNNGVRVKPLYSKSTGIYSARVNLADRLFFYPVKENGKDYLLLIEVIRNHDIDNAKTLKKSSYQLSTHVQKLLACEHQIISDFEEVDGIAQNLQIDSPIPEKLHYYKQQLLIFNDEQNSVKATNLPVVVRGAAGSGKSCVAFNLMLQLADMPSDSTKPVAYITKSADLIDEMKAMWDELPHHHESNNVMFLTYDALLDHFTPDFHNKTCADFSVLEAWLPCYREASKHRLSAQQKMILQNAQDVQQEFRIMSGYTPDAYLQLGKRNSLFFDADQRQCLLETFQAYKAYLESTDQYDPAYLEFNVDDEFLAMVVDESQDFSYRQIQSLKALCSDDNIALCFDIHQSQHDSFSLSPYLRQLFPTLNSVTLPVCYRCPENIIRLANLTIQLKYAATGGKCEKEESSSVHACDNPSKGYVELLSPNDRGLEKITELTQQANVIIITLAEFKAQAAEHFPLATIFTPEEAKGLEFDTVIAYKIFSHAHIYALNTKLKPINGERPDLAAREHRAKQHKRDEQFRPILNQIFTAFTRAKQSLVIYQPNEAKLRYVMPYVSSAVTDMNVSSPSNVLPTPSSPEAWLDMAKYLAQQKKYAEAKDILCKRLSYTEAKANAVLGLPVESVEPQQQTSVRQKPAQPKRSGKKRSFTKGQAKRKNLKNVEPLIPASDFIIKLRSDFSRQTLSELFKRQDCANILFKTIISNTPTQTYLIDDILNDEAMSKTFTGYLYNSASAHSIFTPELLFSSPDESSSENRTLFFSILSKPEWWNVALLKMLARFDHFNNPQSTAYLSENRHVLALIAQLDADLLLEILKSNKALSMSEALADNLTSCEGGKAPVAYTLFIRQPKIFSLLREENVYFQDVHRLSRVVFHSNMAICSKPDKSIMSWSLYSASKMFLELLDFQPQLALLPKTIDLFTQPLEAFPLPDDVMISTQSPLLHLFRSHFHFITSVLIKMAWANSLLFQLPAFLKAFCTSTDDSNESPFSLLAKKSSEDPLLYRLLTTPQTAQSQDYIFTALASIPDSQSGLSCFHMLLNDPTGFIGLVTFFTQNKDFKLSDKFILSLFKQAVISDNNLSLFAILINNNGYRPLLDAIVNNHRGLISHPFFHRFLFRTFVNLDNISLKVSLFTALFVPSSNESDVASTVLSLFENTDSLHQPQDYIDSLPVRYALNNADQSFLSVIGMMTNGSQGLRCFLAIIKLIPDLVLSNDFIQTLCTPHNDTTCSISTPLIKLISMSSASDAMDILEIILLANKNSDNFALIDQTLRGSELGYTNIHYTDFRNADSDPHSVLPMSLRTIFRKLFPANEHSLCESLQKDMMDNSNRRLSVTNILIRHGVFKPLHNAIYNTDSVQKANRL